MARQLRPVELDFAESAPLRLVFAAEVTARPEKVFAALADDVAGWSHWFTGVTRSAPTHGGSGREVHLTGGTRFTETVLAAEPDSHYAYRVDTTNAPGLHALLEDWRLTPSGGGTRLRWMFAADGPAPVRFLLTLARPGLGRAFRESARALDRRLAET
ncbi:SRPBCC family protein [Streptomyces angustmyceticus]|uniref:Polyketide cyclase n=1 Tax=Streptomyces angustmyceticus TaxID=285578 RepID=A0A5J4LLI4_9ACTN|nr:SRPBCC family protein [Streptomyces angustmyceticus]UAL70309.1 SRPBCC family protein [Streptomyces angustmyceticus]GES33364.1 polyketide cyclase [Streptomyces angustmyceticus]